MEEKLYRSMRKVELKVDKTELKLAGVFQSKALQSVVSLKEEYVAIVQHLRNIEEDYSAIAQQVTDWDSCSQDLENSQHRLAQERL